MILLVLVFALNFVCFHLVHPYCLGLSLRLQLALLVKIRPSGSVVNASQLHYDTQMKTTLIAVLYSTDECR